MMEFSDDLKKAISIAQSLTREYSNAEIAPAHLLKGLLHKDVAIRDLLFKLSQDVHYLEEWAEVRIDDCQKTSKIPEIPVINSELRSVLREAENISIKLGNEEITPAAVLTAICTPGVGFNYEQLKTFTLTQRELLDFLLEKKDFQNLTVETVGGDKKEKPKLASAALLKYCIDKNTEAKQGRYDPVVSRNNEIRLITEILGRRQKSNVLIIGDPGVGKTALVHGFIQNIVEDKVPENLRETLVLELDYGSLIAGASYKGEVEDRLKSIISEIQQFDQAILFIDEIHILLDKRGGSSDAVNLLKPELSRGNITVIGATSVDNYTRYIEPDEAFNRQFEIVEVNEPDETTCMRMLQKIVPIYEQYHNLQVEEAVSLEAIRLAKRYLKERALPDSAIGLIDHTMAGIRLMKDLSQNKINLLKDEIEQYRDDKDSKMTALGWFYHDLKNQISPILFSKLNENNKFSKLNTGTEVYNYCVQILENLELKGKEEINSVIISDLCAIVSDRTGIPMGKIQAKERERLLTIEDQLKKRVVGQDHALKNIAEAILESRSGIRKEGQPIGSFFFLGPTGTGKTELAKALAEFLFQDESFLIRFDMSEFKEENSAALLYGAPPGYVGYEEGGLLVNKIRQKPYSVVLFDEIEKAHSSVFDIFLQILDEGKLHDRLGKEGDFSNSIIIFTSNIGSGEIIKSFEQNIVPASNALMEMMGSYFRPEFLGRLTEIVPFAPITENNVVTIFDIHLKDLYKTLKDKGITLEIDENANKKLALSGYTPKYGARPIVGVIRNKLRRPISRMIVSDKLSSGCGVKLSMNKKDELVWEVNEPMQVQDSHS